MGLSLIGHVRKMLLLGKSIITTSPLLTNEVGTINKKGEKTIGMDVKIEGAMIDYVKKNNIPANIFSEEIGTIKFHPNPQYLIAFDPLDGSINYKIGKNIYPFGFLIAIYKGLNPKLKDVITSGAIEYTKDIAWVFDGYKTTTIHRDITKLRNDWVVNKSTPVYLDLHYKEGYEAYRSLAQQILIRNVGSLIGNLSYVLNNIAAGLGGVYIQPEEIGAIYSLIKGSKLHEYL